MPIPFLRRLSDAAIGLARVAGGRPGDPPPWDVAAAAAAPTQRLFIALLPDARARAVLETRRRAWGLPPESGAGGLSPLHLTLHFLGDVPFERVPVLMDALEQVPMTGMRLVLRPPELWKAPVLRADENEALQDLRRRLAHLLLRLELRVENHWTPHVTLARDATDMMPPVQAPNPVNWFATEFALVRSHAAAGDLQPRYRHYEVLARYRTPPSDPAHP